VAETQLTKERAIDSYRGWGGQTQLGHQGYGYEQWRGGFLLRKRKLKSPVLKMRA
jgi:hypothetical protein